MKKPHEAILAAADGTVRAGVTFFLSLRCTQMPNEASNRPLRQDTMTTRCTNLGCHVRCTSRESSQTLLPGVESFDGPSGENHSGGTEGSPDDETETGNVASGLDFPTTTVSANLGHVGMATLMDP